MTKWNYRVVHTIGRKSNYWAIHEVYYDDDGKPGSLTTEECGVVGSSEQELREEFIRYEKALHHPVLVFDDVKNEFVNKRSVVTGKARLALHSDKDS